jgi:hypothetical protein
MADKTSNYNLNLPVPLSPTDANVWGGQLNTNTSFADGYYLSLANNFYGTSAPTIPATSQPSNGQFWVKSSVTPWVLQVYDGTNWLSIGTINPSTHVWTPSGLTATGVFIQTFTTSGTYTPTSGMIYCVIEMVGGGGGGGGSYGIGAGGGGGGEYAKGVFSASAIGSSQAVTIGAAGTGGPNATTNGTNGGLTSVGLLISAGGGSFGQSNNNSPYFSNGGLGGTGGSGGNLRSQGGPGSVGNFFNNGGANDVSVGGMGGASLLGFGGISPAVKTTSGSLAGNNAVGYGGGGSGGASRTVVTNGGNGFAGYVIITEYK